MLKLVGSAFDAIRAHGEKAFPHECCGVLFGSVDGSEKRVTAVHAIENQFDEEERYHRFLITPEDYRNAETLARTKKLDILGFYHSHPDSPSIASKYDLDHAFPWFSYLIISVYSRTYRDHHSWVMEDDRSKFNEEIVIVE
jgi:proteasome lid subunit RPN8/RPN11